MKNSTLKNHMRLLAALMALSLNFSTSVLPAETRVQELMAEVNTAFTKADHKALEKSLKDLLTQVPRVKSIEECEDVQALYNTIQKGYVKLEKPSQHVLEALKDLGPELDQLYAKLLPQQLKKFAQQRAAIEQDSNAQLKALNEEYDKEMAAMRAAFDAEFKQVPEVRLLYSLIAIVPNVTELGPVKRGTALGVLKDAFEQNEYNEKTAADWKKFATWAKTQPQFADLTSKLASVKSFVGNEDMFRKLFQGFKDAGVGF